MNIVKASGLLQVFACLPTVLHSECIRLVADITWTCVYKCLQREKLIHLDFLYVIGADSAEHRRCPGMYPDQSGGPYSEEELSGWPDHVVRWPEPSCVQAEELPGGADGEGAHGRHLPYPSGQSLIAYQDATVQYLITLALNSGIQSFWNLWQKNGLP